jgi:hypothetical protein
MELAELKQAVPGLADKSHYDKIKIFGWWLHKYKKQPSFTGAGIAKCYDALHFSKPSSFGGYISHLAEKKELLKTGSAYKVENKIREKMDAAYGTPEITLKVTSLLTDLAATIPDMAERAYCQEALICYKHGSTRGAVVMTWNIAFSHLCDHVLTKRLPDFNARWQVSFPGMHKGNKGIKTIAVFDDFAEELKEQQVLEICRDAGIINKNIYNIMHVALGKRNAAAHPNAVVIDQVRQMRTSQTSSRTWFKESSSWPVLRVSFADDRYHRPGHASCSRLPQCKGLLATNTRTIGDLRMLNCWARCRFCR